MDNFIMFKVETEFADATNVVINASNILLSGDAETNSYWIFNSSFDDSVGWKISKETYENMINYIETHLILKIINSEEIDET